MTAKRSGAPAAGSPKHTPGPWRAEGEYVVDAKGNGMCTWSAADAKLIAAAPDLAIALEWMLNDDSLEARTTALAVLRAAGRDTSGASPPKAAP